VASQTGTVYRPESWTWFRSIRIVVVFGGKDPFTPRWFSDSITALADDSPREIVSAERRAQPFNGELTSKEIGALAEELRTSFLLFCNHTPTLAAQYCIFGKHADRDTGIRALLKFRGSLAQPPPRKAAR